ncbi:MAG: hypothetical protein Q8R92_13775 [Deltaproteobacteria bacterium]|nr:hypothetical protein [Deltaproteobacteria bacterium]
MRIRRKSVLRFIGFGFWILWVLYLGVFVNYQIQRYNAPADAPPRAPFVRNGARYAPPPPWLSLTLFGVMGFALPGALYLAPRTFRRLRTPKRSKD